MIGPVPNGLPPEPPGIVERVAEIGGELQHTYDDFQRGEELSRRLGEIAVEHAVRMGSTHQPR